MSTSRDEFIANVRRGLGRGPVDATTRRELEARLNGHRRNLVPARGQVTGRQKIDDFVRMVEFALATIVRVKTDADVPGAVADYLKQQNLPAQIRMAPDKRLDAIPWNNRPLLQIARGKPVPSDEVGLSGAFAGIAETGTLMLVSGPETPSTLNFLPETHVVVIRTEEIVGGYEDGWARLREKLGAMPRTVNFITGPSRSGDIEQTLQLGAHGPRRLHVVLVDDGAAGGERS
jgi:L-lactate dehydrogenase complex protein LldG